MDSDIAACEKKLGKEPPLATHENTNHQVTLSQNITERLQTGTVDSERLDNYDTYWINKLACIDESHSVRNNLDIEEAEEKLQNIMKYTQRATAGQKDSALHQMMEKDSVKNCFEMSQGHTLNCNVLVENFVEQVDRLMYDAVRKDPSASFSLSDKKLTYAERFKREFQY